MSEGGRQQIIGRSKICNLSYLLWQFEHVCYAPNRKTLPGPQIRPKIDTLVVFWTMFKSQNATWSSDSLKNRHIYGILHSAWVICTKRSDKFVFEMHQYRTLISAYPFRDKIGQPKIAICIPFWALFDK